MLRYEQRKRYITTKHGGKLKQGSFSSNSGQDVRAADAKSRLFINFAFVCSLLLSLNILAFERSFYLLVGIFAVDSSTSFVCISSSSIF